MFTHSFIRLTDEPTTNCNYVVIVHCVHTFKIKPIHNGARL